MNTDYHNYRSFDLLFRIYPEAAEQLLTAMGAGFVIIYEFYNITDIIDLDLYISLTKYMTNFTDTPEKYMEETSLQEASDNYDKAAFWLVEHDIPERFFVFQILTLFISYILYGLAQKPNLWEYRKDEYLEFEILLHELAEPMQITMLEVSETLAAAQKFVKEELENESTSHDL